MKRIFFVTVILLLALAGAAVLAAVKGYYPVAIVEGRWITAAEWIRFQEGILRSIASQTEVAGEPALDFASREGRAVIEEVRKKSLILLIEDAIVEQKGAALWNDLARRAKGKAQESLAGRAAIARAVETAYGYTMEEFTRFIVAPQSRRDAITEHLKETGREFESWLESAKSEAHVRLLFVPFEWDEAR
jgi:hypothetical protein